MSWEKIKLGLWGAIGGSILLMLVGFSWGGWVTGGTAKEQAAEMTATAMVERLAPLCLIRFNEDPEKDHKLEELKKANSWERRDYVAQQGWATVLGEKEPDHEVAGECVTRLMKTS